MCPEAKNVSFFPSVPSECEEKSDCPNEGQNYVCNTGVCECATGLRTDYFSDSCLGMLPNFMPFFLKKI